VLVVFPDGTQVVVPFKEDTLLIQLLPKVHKLKRLRLYTNEYVFAVSAADQKHLKVKHFLLGCFDVKLLAKSTCTCTYVLEDNVLVLHCTFCYC